MDRRACQLPIGHMKIVSAHRQVQLRDVVGADLVPQAARSRMDQENDSVYMKVVLRRGLFVENLVDALNLNKMVAGSESSELRATSLFRAVADGVRVGA